MARSNALVPHFLFLAGLRRGGTRPLLHSGDERTDAKTVDCITGVSLFPVLRGGHAEAEEGFLDVEGVVPAGLGPDFLAFVFGSQFVGGLSGKGVVPDWFAVLVAGFEEQQRFAGGTERVGEQGSVHHGLAFAAVSI